METNLRYELEKQRYQHMLREVDINRLVRAPGSKETRMLHSMTSTLRGWLSQVIWPKANRRSYDPL